MNSILFQIFYFLVQLQTISLIILFFIKISSEIYRLDYFILEESIQINQSEEMGCQQIKTSRQEIRVPQPQEIFKSDLKKFHKRYVSIVLYMRQTRIFEKRTSKLENLVEQYLQNNHQFEEDNMALASIDSVKKLHPIDCKKSEIVTKEWLISSCLRQDKFCVQTKVQRVTFQHAYPEYLEFLLLCKAAIGTKKITVPTKCQDIIWHSHMLDIENYQMDMRSYVGIFLNHKDDYAEDELKAYTKQTWARKGLQYNENKKIKQQKISMT